MSSIVEPSRRSFRGAEWERGSTVFVQGPAFGTRPLLRDLARERLRDEIMAGVLAPGTLLDDGELAQRLRCSRTPVREALADLELGGLVERRANRYTRVALPRAADIVPTLQALGLLYGGLVRVSVPRLDDTVRSSLCRRIAALLDAVRIGDWNAVADTAAPVYRSFIASCDNPVLCSALRGSIDALTFRLRHEDLPSVLPWDRFANGIVALRLAVEGGDGRLAERALWSMHLLPDPDRPV